MQFTLNLPPVSTQGFKLRMPEKSWVRRMLASKSAAGEEQQEEEQEECRMLVR